MSDRGDAERPAPAYFESIVETLHEPLLVLFPDLRVRSANQAFYTHFRVNRADTQGQLIYELGNGQWDIPALRTLLEDVLPDNNVFDNFEVRHDFEALGPRIMLVNARRLEHAEMILLGVRDITDAKRAEDALRASELRHRALFEAVDEGVCLFERLPLRADGLRDYRYVAMNPAMQAMFGVPDLSGQSIRDTFPGEAEDWYDHYDRVLDTGEPVRFVRTSETQGMVLETFVTRVEDDSGHRLLAVMQDITERKRAQESLRVSEARQAFLLTLSDALRPLHDPVEILAAASQAVGRHFQVGRCGYAEVPAPYDHLVVARDWTNGIMPSLQGVWPLASFGETFLAQYRTGQTVVVEDALHDDRARGHEAGLAAAGGLRSSVSVQLMKEGRWVSSFYVQDTVPRHWTESEIELLEEVAQRTWAAVERTRAEEALRRAHDLLEERVRERTAQVQSLFGRLVSAQEEERRRIARDIHDQLGQQMTALRMNLELLTSPTEHDDALAAQLARTQQLAEELDRSVDLLTWDLRPAALDHLGLPAALEKLVAEWSARYRIAAVFDEHDTGSLRLARDAEANLYRIVQEALHNVLRHAQATRVGVSLQRRGGEVLLAIEDNGRGFDPNPAAAPNDGTGLGLVNMRERGALVGGSVDIESAPGWGTTIFVRVPVATAPPEA